MFLGKGSTTAAKTTEEIQELLASADMEIVDDGTPAQVEEILAQAAIAGTSSLPLPDVRQRMFNGYPLAEFAPPLRSLLALA